MKLITIGVLALLACSPFAVAAPITENETEAPITPSYHYDLYRDQLPTCFDYREALDIGKDELYWYGMYYSIVFVMHMSYNHKRIGHLKV